MKVSEHYQLGRTQATLDFVDVDITNDVPVYIDPSAVKHVPDDWGQECEMLLSTFFDSVLDSVRTKDKARLDYLLGNLGEPNETHLGLSRGKSAGRGFGAEMRKDFIEKLYESAAAHTGLIEDLEDTAFFLDRVGSDIVSDITTNIIRGPLIAYTRQQAEVFGMAVEEVWSGQVWDAVKREWDHGFVDLPAPGGQKLLLVPKLIVRRAMHLDRNEYYNHHLIPTLQAEEEEHPTGRLLRAVRGGGRRVTKKAVKEFYGARKSDFTRLSLDRPSVYKHYKEVKAEVSPEPISHDELAEATNTAPPDFKELLQAVLDTPTGRDNASDYHRRVEALLSALFHPSLGMMQFEDAIHEGRKRVDISYTNVASRGFFRHIVLHRIPARQIFVECKNYGPDIKNPEIDQLAGRFSPTRGKFGIIACRRFKDKEMFLKRCRDTVKDHRGHIITLDDDDLRTMVKDVQSFLDWDPSAPALPDTPAPPQIHDYPLLYSRLRDLES